MPSSLVSMRGIWLPAALFVAQGAVIAWAWSNYRKSRDEEVRHESALVAEQVGVRFQEALAARLAVVDHVRAEFERGTLPTREAFSAQALDLQRLFAGFQAIARIDDAGVIRWLDPEAPNRTAQDFDLHHHPDAAVAATFIEAERTGVPQITPVTTLLVGERGIVAYYPVVVAGRRDGYVCGAFRVADLIRAGLQEGMPGHYRLALYEDEDRLLALGAQTDLADAAFGHRRSISLGRGHWTLEVRPTQPVVDRVQGVTAHLWAVLGLLLAAGIAWLGRLVLLRQASERRALSELQESEERLRAVVAQVPLALWSTDAEDRITYATGGVLEALGFTPAQILGRRVPEVAADRPQMLALYEALRAGEPAPDPIEADGRVLVTTAHRRTDAGGAFLGLSGVTVDSSERARAQCLLQTVLEGVAGAVGAEFFRSLAAHLARALDGALVFVSARENGRRANGNGLGEAPAAAPDTGLIRIIASSQPARLAEDAVITCRDTPCEQVLQGETRVYPRGVQAQFPRATMLREFGIESYLGTPLVGADRRVLGALSVIAPVPLADPPRAEALLRIFAVRAAGELERREAERALRRSEETLRLIVEGSPGFFFYLHGPDGVFTYLSASVRDVTGRTPEEWMRHYTSYLTDAPANARVVAETEATLRDGSGAEAYPVEVWHADGRRVQLEVFERPIIEDGRVVAIQGVAHDVTDRLQAEAQRRTLETKLQEAQRLESLGILAGGIAHDFNNLLQAMLGNAGLALMDLDERHAARPAVEQIRQAARRATALTQQLLAYSGKGRFRVRPLSLNPLVEELSRLLRVTLSQHATLVAELAPDLPAVMADAGQMQQVIMNLIINSSEALGDRPGTVTLRTGARDADAPELVGLEFPPGRAAPRYVLLEVSDTGVGMDADTLARIFEPFFSTKFTGRGLGLAAVQGIVRGHGGALRVDSALGRGTTFTLFFPATDATADDDAPVAPSAQPFRGRGLVLVIDDEPEARETTRRMVERLGFEVVHAADGRAGLEAFADARRSVVCVLLDLTMPHLDGQAAFAALRAHDPGLPVILMSGYSEETAWEKVGRDEPVCFFLAKPFSSEALADALRRAVAGR